MKNIRIYKASKYNSDLWKEVEPNIYATYEHDDSNCLALEEVRDASIVEAIHKLEGWEKGKSELEDDLYTIFYDGKKYYKEIDADENTIYQDQAPSLLYVTSLMFEQEPEYEENETFEEVSQYPLEDILDKFSCACEDFYESENKNDPINSYLEFSSSDLEDIRELLSIVGKHVYNKEEGGYVKLIIE